jgi:hypothetical protein
MHATSDGGENRLWRFMFADVLSDDEANMVMGVSRGLPTEVSEQFFNSLSDEYYDSVCIHAYYDSNTP